MSKAIISEELLTDIADELRDKYESTDTYTPAQMADAVSGLTKVSGSITINVNGSIDVTRYASANVDVPSEAPTLQDKTVNITPTTTAQSQTVSADSGYDGLDEVTINTAAVPTGTEGTPTATKGAVSNHSVSVTPAVTNDAGMIVGGTHTGTPVTVSASELVSGSETKTQNGTYDVTNLAELVVNVQSGGGGGGYTADEIAMRTISGVVSGSASRVREQAFISCPSITGASFPSATSIGFSAFYSCTALDTISFPMVKTIGAEAFVGCVALTEANFPAATSIWSSAFNHCTALTELSFPNVASIEICAFEYCSTLTSANFPAATRIGRSAFLACSALTTVSLPHLKSLGNYAFRSCRKLLSLYILSVSAIPSVGSSTFYYTPIGGYTTYTSGEYGSVFVPSSLYNSFLTAANWSRISARIVSV